MVAFLLRHAELDASLDGQNGVFRLMARRAAVSEAFDGLHFRLIR